MALFKSSDDNEIIAELLPYVHPHEGVLRAQLHRDGNPADKEELRFIFSFTCGKCDHKKSVGYSVAIMAAQKMYAERVLNNVAERLKAFCGEIRGVPCMGLVDLSLYAQHVTEMLMMHGTMTAQELKASWETWFPDKPPQYAFAVAEHLGFKVPGADYYELPSDHPWNKRTPDDWK